MGRLYLPEWGEPMPRSRPGSGPTERVLHLAIANGDWQQPGLTAGLARLGPTKRVAWAEIRRSRGDDAARRAVIEGIEQHRPTLIWMQVHGPCFLAERAFLQRVRAAAPPPCMLVTWTGDVADHESGRGVSEWSAPWMVEMAHEVDLFLACQCNYPQALVEQHNVPASCGFLQCGFDEELFDRRPACEPVPGVGGIVWLATRYPHVSAYRDQVVDLIVGKFPDTLVVYGGGWRDVPGVVWPGHGMKPMDSSHLYGHARLSVASSLHDGMRRYTSNRLPHIMASGGVALVRAFPDMGGLGCVDGVNCLVWRTSGDLLDLVGRWLRPEYDEAREAIRWAAHQLAYDRMAWSVVAEELAWMVRAERAQRSKTRHWQRRPNGDRR